MRFFSISLCALAVFVALGAAATAATTETEGPRLRVLGTMQDGGLPHAACACDRCERARRDGAFKRHVASLALLLPDDDGVGIHLVDATPDIGAQIEALADVRTFERGGVDRAPISGVLLTHAHMGHYLGLAHLGFEVVHARGVAVRCAPRMAGFLRSNGPWEQLVEKREIDIVETPAGRPYTLGGVRVTPVAVPHRDEYSETVAYLFEGPRASVFYCPDTDGWRFWDRPLIEALKDVDVALLDGTFYSMDELPGRDASQVKHPLMTRTMDLLEARVGAGELRVLFTHMNHTNRAIEPGSAVRLEIERRGFEVAREGMEIGL